MIKGKVPKISSEKNINRSERGDLFIPRPGKLILSDGKSYEGMVPKDQSGTFYGEVVFNTGMTGYVESITDPSYANQILVFTYPLIGNYGVQESDSESNKIQVSGVVVSELALFGSHKASSRNFLNWLQSQNIPVITDIDTRELTKHLRSNGTMIGSISTEQVKMKNKTLTPAKVSIDKPKTYNESGSKKVILVDCGTKDNILQSLIEMNACVTRVPAEYDYTDMDYDGIVLSNGPGDPTDYPETIRIVKKAFEKNKPIFGICLGNQVMALAAGAKTYKLPFGHRGHNQPCMDLTDQKCYITSQNHGYAIKEKSLPKDWVVSFRNLNDESIEGISHKSKPFFSVQFHPEACPGPTDTAWLFERFREVL
ncbi:MAG: glutamine-hydrolyzing carbamoyl-phosphate synthase small subunit [Candidatus Saccharimonadales bacterium]